MAQKSAKKSQVIPYVTPWFTARYPKISKPDVESKGGFKPDGKFKTDGLLEEGDIEPVREVLVEAAKKLWPELPLAEIQLPMKEFFDGKKGDPNRKSAGWGIWLKSQFRPAVFDAKKHKLPEGKVIGPGSVIRVASSIFPWTSNETETIVDKATGEKTKEVVTTYGIGLRLGDTQVKSLAEFQGSGDGAAFDEVEGFEYEVSDTDAFGADGATDL